MIAKARRYQIHIISCCSNHMLGTKCFKSSSCISININQSIVIRYSTSNKRNQRDDTNNSNKVGVIALLNMFNKQKYRYNGIHQIFNGKLAFTNSKTKDSHQQTNKTCFKRIYTFFEEVLHVEDVRRAQQHVINIKNELHETGNKKRFIQRDLDKLRQELNRVYKDYKINRNTGQYLELVKKEMDIYMDIDELQKELTVVDGHEQYLFNAFSVAINDSYEKEKIYTNMIKVMGIVGTLLGSFITFVFSVVGLLYNQRKFYTFQKDVESSLIGQLLPKLDKAIDEMKKFEETMHGKQSHVLMEKPVESWSSYLNRQTQWIYSWAFSKK